MTDRNGPSDAPLRIRGLRKRFGRAEVLHGIDLLVPRGAIFGFVGLNGAGKTTTLECSLGLLGFDSGEVSICGRPARAIHETRGRVGAVFDRPCLHPHLTACQELEHGWLACGRAGRPPLDAARLLGLEPVLGRTARKLSWGNQRRLSIALALLGSPELVILDEPFAGLDPGAVEDLVAVIGRLRAEAETTFLLSSHQLELVERLSTHLALIHGGRILAQGETRDLLRPARPPIRLEVDSVPRALETIARRWPDLRATGEEPYGLEVEAGPASAADINGELVRSGVRVSRLHEDRPSLSDLFRQLTGRGC